MTDDQAIIERLASAVAAREWHWLPENPMRLVRRPAPPAARDKAGLADCHFHDSRHTAITRLAKRLAVLDLARMVGHRDLRQLMVYYNESAEDLAAKLG